MLWPLLQLVLLVRGKGSWRASKTNLAKLFYISKTSKTNLAKPSYIGICLLFFFGYAGIGAGNCRV